MSAVLVHRLTFAYSKVVQVIAAMKFDKHPPFRPLVVHLHIIIKFSPQCFTFVYKKRTQ